jgi:ribokinase
LVVTQGPKGVLVTDGTSDEVISVPAYAVDVVDTVGAGDVFCGFLGAWLATGASVLEAVRAANAAAALAVTRPGAGLSAPFAVELDRFPSPGTPEPPHVGPVPAVRPGGQSEI